MNNTGLIFRRALRDSRGAIIGWGIGMAVFSFYVSIIFPFIQGFEEFNQLMENPIMQAFLGSAASFVTPAGFLGVYFFTFAPLVLAVYGVMYGIGIVLAEEDQGTLDVLLSLPVPRWKLILERYVAFIVGVLLILAITLVGFFIGVILTPDLAIDLGAMLLGILNIFPVLLFITTLTLLLSTILRSRGTVGGIAAAVLVVSYFLNSLAEMMEAPLSNMRYGSIFYYYGGASVLVNGIEWGGFLLLTILTVFMFGLALFAFERRDLGT